MAHDRNKQPVKPGDRVLVPCTVRAVYEGEDFCNVLLETDEPCHPGEHRTQVSLNAGQVELIEGVDEAEKPAG